MERETVREPARDGLMHVEREGSSKSEQEQATLPEITKE